MHLARITVDQVKCTPCYSQFVVLKAGISTAPQFVETTGYISKASSNTRVSSAMSSHHLPSQAMRTYWHTQFQPRHQSNDNPLTVEVLESYHDASRTVLSESKHDTFK